MFITSSLSAISITMQKKNSLSSPADMVWQFIFHMNKLTVRLRLEQQTWKRLQLSVTNNMVLLCPAAIISGAWPYLKLPTKLLLPCDVPQAISHLTL
jgi:hypothetical protein